MGLELGLTEMAVTLCSVPGTELSGFQCFCGCGGKKIIRLLRAGFVFPPCTEPKVSEKKKIAEKIKEKEKLQKKKQEELKKRVSPDSFWVT